MGDLLGMALNSTILLTTVEHSTSLEFKSMPETKTLMMERLHRHLCGARLS